MILDEYWYAEFQKKETKFLIVLVLQNRSILNVQKKDQSNAQHDLLHSYKN